MCDYDQSTLYDIPRDIIKLFFKRSLWVAFFLETDNYVFLVPSSGLMRSGDSSKEDEQGSEISADDMHYGRTQTASHTAAPQN